MTDKPSYVVHSVTEKEITVDWFFGKGHLGKKIAQFFLLLIAWFFAVLPVVVTASAILNRDNPDKGWWNYAEGFTLWDTTIAFLAFFVVLFVIGYLVLFLVNRASEKGRNATATYDETRLSKRLEIAEHLYAEKFGPPALREQQRHVKIQPYADIETFELRGLYRDFGVE
jgi:uncharacterized membrane protein